MNSCEKEESEENVINLEDDLSQAENETLATSSKYAKVEKIADILRGPSNEMLNHRLQLRRYDFATLSGAEYLNDMIVNNYMVLIKERNKADPSLPQVFAYDTFLYT